MADINEILQTLLIQEYAKQFFRSPEETEKGKLTLKALKRADALSDVSLLDTMLKDATTGNEWKLARKAYKDVKARNTASDPVIRDAIEQSGDDIEEGSNLYNQFQSSVRLVNGLIAQKELDDPTAEGLTWEDIVKKNSTLNRFKHIIDLGKDKKFTFTPEKGTGEGYLHSNLASNRLDEYIKEFDVLVKARMDTGDGVELPPDAKRAVQVGDLAGFEAIKTRDTGTYRNLYNTHSTRYHTLHNLKMDTDVKKNAGDEVLNLFPDNMITDLKDRGPEAVKAFMDALSNNQATQLAFMNGRGKEGGVVTVDLDTYSLLLDSQMEIEKTQMINANNKFKSYTGDNVEDFKESTTYESMKESIKNTGLQVDGADVTTGTTDAGVTKITIPYSGLPENVRTSLEYSNIQGDYSIANIIKHPDVDSKTRNILSRKSTIKKVNKSIEDKLIDMTMPAFQTLHGKMFTPPSFRKDIKGEKGKYTGVVYNEEAPKIRFKYTDAIRKENKEYQKKKAQLDRDYSEFTIGDDKHTIELREHGKRERAKLKKTHDDYIKRLRESMNTELQSITGISSTKALDRHEIIKMALQYATKAGKQPWFKDMNEENQKLLMQLVKGYKSNLSLIERKAP